MHRSASITASVLVHVLVACNPGGKDLTTTGATASTSSGTEGDTSGGMTSNGETTGVGGAPCACAAPGVYEGDLDLAGLAAYKGTCLVEVTGILSLKGVTDPADLAPLAHLQRTRWLNIRDSPGLVDLDVFSCLRETLWIDLTDNPALADIHGLDGIEVAEDVWISGSPLTTLSSFAPGYQGVRHLTLDNLPELTDLDALAGWPGLNDPDAYDGEMSVVVTGAPKLTSVAGLAGLLADGIATAPDDPFLGEITVELGELPALGYLVGLETFTRGALTLRRLPAILDLVPLAALERASRLRIAGLSGLTSMTGLSALRRADHLIIGGCEEGEAMTGLTSIDGLDALLKIDYGLSIVEAPVLSDLGGAPLLVNALTVEMVDTPLLDPAAVDAFLDQVNALSACFGDVVECGCLGESPDSVQSGCPTDWSGGSGVIGGGAGGPFDGVTAFFGWAGPGPFDPTLNLVFLDASADIDDAKAGGLLNKALGTPKAILETDIDYQGWLGAHSSPADLHYPGAIADQGDVEITISARLGNWQTPDPADPPRLTGTVSTTDPDQTLQLAGSFDAVFCDAFVKIYGD